MVELEIFRILVNAYERFMALSLRYVVFSRVTRVSQEATSRWNPVLSQQLSGIRFTVAFLKMGLLISCGAKQYLPLTGTPIYADVLCHCQSYESMYCHLLGSSKYVILETICWRGT